MELKHGTTYDYSLENGGFNRTFMELKPDSTIRDYPCCMF